MEMVERWTFRERDWDEIIINVRHGFGFSVVFEHIVYRLYVYAKVSIELKCLCHMELNCNWMYLLAL